MVERAQVGLIGVRTGLRRTNAPDDPLRLRLGQLIGALKILCHPVPALPAQLETAGQQQAATTLIQTFRL